MYICIYIYIIYIYIYIFLSLSIYIYIYIYVYHGMYICTPVCTPKWRAVGECLHRAAPARGKGRRPFGPGDLSDLSPRGLLLGPTKSLFPLGGGVPQGSPQGQALRALLLSLVRQLPAVCAAKSGARSANTETHRWNGNPRPQPQKIG